jgi:hypothetical protein
MDGTLSLTNSTLAYADVGVTSNPTKKYVDWSVERRYSVRNPKSNPFTIDPGATTTLFSGLRTVAIDGTTEFRLNLSTLAATRYRFTWDGVGTNPILRTARTLALATRAVTVTLNGNNTVTMAANAGDFNNLVAGDTLFIPDTTTGDAAAPFNPINTGYWVVLAVVNAGASVQLARPAGAGFIAYAETVTVASNPQVLAYSAAGVQVGDSVNVSAGFAAAVWGTYSVVAVTSLWFEVIATLPLPSGVTALPGAAGLQFYTNAKRYVRIEADQPCVIRYNGDTGNTNQVAPWAVADPDNTGWTEKCGPCWTAVVVNLSSSPLNLLFISAE